MWIVLYHRTARANAENILRGGFRDYTNSYGTGRLHTGVWLSNVPLDENEGAVGDVLLQVSLDFCEAELQKFEWIQERNGYREWLVPAKMINAHGKVRIAEVREEWPYDK